MRQRLVLFSLFTSMSLASASFAQTRKKPAAGKEEDRARAEAGKNDNGAKAEAGKNDNGAKAEAGKNDNGAKAEPAGADKPAAAGDATAASAADDLGAPPPKDVAEQKPEQKPSPLTPAPNEFPTGVAKPPPFEYDKLLGDIAALRSRVSALTTTLYASKLRVVVETKGEDARLASFHVTLDDGVVFAAPDRFAADDERTVYEHAVAPGHHVVGVEIERFDARNKEFRTWQSSRFSVVIPESKLVDTHLTIVDDSDMAEDFPDDQDGQYDLRVKLRARVVEE